IDAAFFVLRRAERSAIVKIGPTIPITVPTMLLESIFQVFHVLAITVGLLCLSALIAERYETAQRGIEKPANPDALALAHMPNAIHAIIPVARTHQRQAVLPDCQTALDRTSAVFKNRRRF